MVVSNTLQPGQRLLYVSDVYVGFCTFVADRSGWPHVQFVDESETVVDPEAVYPFNEASFGLLLDRYGLAIRQRDALLANHLSGLVEEMADEVGYKDHVRLKNIHTTCERMIQEEAA